jgi:hypothetical protein
MSVLRNITRTWRKPTVVIRELFAHGQREDRAVAYLMAACLLIFIAQWPRLARKSAGFELSEGAQAPEFTQLVAYEFMAWLMIWPLFFYIIAGVTHLIAKLFGGKGTHYGARLALFWALLATSPVLLLHGLTAGFIGPGAQTNLVGVIWLIGFGVIWLMSLLTMERADAD